MSITFQPSMGLPCTIEERCGYCDDGMTDVDVCNAPTLQFSNGTAAGLQRLLGIPFEEWGDIPREEIPSFLRRFMLLLSDDSARAGVVEPPSDTRGKVTTKVTTNEDGLPEIVTQGGCRVINLGTSDEQTVRRLTALRELFVRAHRNDSGISWG